MVSRIGLPLSIVSMKARVSRLASIRSAIRFRMLARYAGDVPFQLIAAACAASRALSTSSWVERATSHSGWPVIGVGLTKYCPRAGGDVLPGDPVVVAGADGDGRLEAGSRLGKGGEFGLSGCGTHMETPEEWAMWWRAMSGPPGIVKA